MARFKKAFSLKIISITIGYVLLFYATPYCDALRVPLEGHKRLEEEPYEATAATHEYEISSIRNTNGETFEDVWQRMNEEGVLEGVLDPRTLPIDPEEVEFLRKYAVMKSEDLRGVLATLISEGVVNLQGDELEQNPQDNPNLVKGFVDYLSAKGQNMEHHCKSPDIRLANKPLLEAMLGQNALPEEAEAEMRLGISNGYKYRALMRVITIRWSRDPSELFEIVLPNKPPETDL